MNEGLCGTGNNLIRRDIVAETLSVFAMYDNEKFYGAIQMGKHDFIPPKQIFEGKAASFIHLWLIQESEWKIARVLSYDHL